jgi:MerR family copper efflux transcriptional regulator
MQIKEFAHQTGLPAKTIRYYEDIGLLPQPRRLGNGYRVYDESDVSRARLVAVPVTLTFPMTTYKKYWPCATRRKPPVVFYWSYWSNGLMK